MKENLTPHYNFNVTKFFAGIFLFLCAAGAFAAGNARFVDPTIGSDVCRWFFFNAATRPEGMVNPSADTGPAGYWHQSAEIRRFSVVHGFHLVAPAFMPVTDEVDAAAGWAGWKSPFSHENEIAEAGYHKVTLDRYGTTVELTATERVALARMRFAGNADARIVFDLKDEMDTDEAGLSGGFIERVNDKEIRGWADCRFRDFIQYRVFFSASFDVPFGDLKTWQGESNLLNYTVASFHTNRVVQMKMAVSWCSMENARNNIEAELPGWDFAAARTAAREAWNERLDKVEVTGGTEADKRKFYTDLFHSLTGRGVASDANGEYPDYGTLSLIVRHLPPSNNIAPLAAVTASSWRPGAEPAKAVDGVAGRQQGGEWISHGENNPWLRLNWKHPQRISRVDLLDRSNGRNSEHSARLLFSDGGAIDVNNIPTDGSTREVLLPGPKTVSWIKLQVTGGAGGDAGLSEIKVYDATNRPVSGVYNHDSFWWCHMTHDIAWGLFWPDVLDNFARADLLWYENDPRHRLPRCLEAGKRDWTMTGLEAAPMLARRLMMKADGFNRAEALAAMEECATRDAVEYPEIHWTPIENLFGEYARYRYIPADIGDDFSAGKTVEHSFTDWCIAEAAKSMGHRDDYAYFSKRSKNWTNVFDPAIGYLRPRKKDGSWVVPFDPLRGNVGFCEANSAQYTWFATHDIATLCRLLGGQDSYCDKLNHAFESGEPVSFTDAYVSEREISYSNEADLQAAFLFNYAGRPWLTQKWSRAVHTRAYGNATTSTSAYASNDEDQGNLGSLSALFAIGLYSVRGGVGDPPVYDIGSPLFDSITIHLDPHYYPGRTFAIKTVNNSPANVYVQSARLNGNWLERCWLSQDEIFNGGRLELTMGPRPNTRWGVKTPPPP